MIKPNILCSPNYIFYFRNDIMELINRERIVIIKGETGCGKSIRVPQYVLEGWSKSEKFRKTPCRILVTEPRRIAAISLAEYVAYERQEEVCLFISKENAYNLYLF